MAKNKIEAEFYQTMLRNDAPIMDNCIWAVCHR